MSISKVIFLAYVLVSAANVFAVSTGSQGFDFVTKFLLIPLLLVWILLSAQRPLGRPVGLLAGGAFFAWLGDVALEFDGIWFIGGMALFLTMQILYIAAFRSVPGIGLVRAWPIALVPFILLWFGLSAVMVAHSGLAAIPGVVYGVALVAMVISALDMVLRVPRRQGWRVFCGALLFLISDALIALTAFAGMSESQGLSAIVMLTYTIAQAMIVTGFVEATNQLKAQAG